ncbi:hypothetical protein BDY19DRAFT_402966 [Irpex rosettiformis]|uniref:Uncharacterized protein n=1 Tax=Irpex rosettiformis TaxID=378272 RepID=A0ACB8UF82_9APHY|nr:hypothetical protein BDY19DRAFT_402966 [Irpex rosettiformis]
MRFSAAVVAVAVLAAQPVFSVPIIASSPLHGVVSAPTRTHRPISQAFIDNLMNNVHSLREVDELMQRDEFSVVARELEDLLARADDDESGASLFNTAKKIFKVLGIGLDGVNIASNLAPSQPQPSPSAPARRDLQELNARFGIDNLSVNQVNKNLFSNSFPQLTNAGPIRPLKSFPIIARELTPSQKYRLKLFSDPPRIRPTLFGTSPFDQVAGAAGANSRREFVELLVRQLADDESGASLGTSLSKVFNKVKTIFGGGSTLEKVSNGVSIVSDGTTIASNLLPGQNQAPPPAPQARELVEILARQLADDESGASLASSLSKVFSTVKSVFNDGKTLGRIADGASVVSSASNIAGGLLHPAAPAQSQAPQRREFDSVLARAMEARELNELD